MSVNIVMFEEPLPDVTCAHCRASYAVRKVRHFTKHRAGAFLCCWRHLVEPWSGPDTFIFSRRP